MTTFESHRHVWAGIRSEYDTEQEEQSYQQRLPKVTLFYNQKDTLRHTDSLSKHTKYG